MKDSIGENPRKSSLVAPSLKISNFFAQDLKLLIDLEPIIKIISTNADKAKEGTKASYKAATM